MTQPLSPVFISGIFTLVIYLMTLLSMAMTLRSSQQKRTGMNILTLAAIAIHGFYLYLAIEGHQEGQNLNLINMLGLSLWLSSWILLFHSFNGKTQLIWVITSCLVIITTAMGFSSAHQNTLYLKGQWASLVHIFSAMVAMGFLLLASMQSVLLLFADKKLRTHPTSYPDYLPPLQSIEKFLFHLLVVGFLLMSMALVIAVLLLKSEWASQPLHKSILSVFAWIIFATLLAGHHWIGWRGTIAAKWTVIGFTLLAIGYFGSKFVLEIIMQ